MVNEMKEKNLFLETDLALHDHCHNCVILSIPSLCQRYGCAVIACPHDCGHQFHSCKTEEHLLLCPLVKTPCINACYGCPLWIIRKDLGRHLSTCPASIVYCHMERNRKPLREYGKKLKGRDGGVDDERFRAGDKDLSDGNQEIDTEDHVALDLALAYSDQRQINNVYQLPRNKRKLATDFFNKRHPAVPLLPKPRWVDNKEMECAVDDEACPADEGDSSEDEAAARKRSAMIMSPVARECILCKIDPSSQHLHQLGSMVNGEGAELPSVFDWQNIELDENANESTALKSKGKSWAITTTKGGSFYTDRGLLIDLSADFLPTHYPKCGSYYTIVCDQSVRRDEYGDHFANVHNDIVDGLDGWSLTRCPLWRYGCTCYATRLEPSGGNRKVVYNHWRDAFAIKFRDQACDQRNRSITVTDKDTESTNGQSAECHFLALPYDIVCHVCTMLDPSSLFCLASACRSLNDFIRFSLLPSRGLVERVWMKTESKTQSGRARWIQGPKRWRLSKSFEPVLKWRINTIGRLVDHIQKCPYYEPLVHQEERIPVLTFAKPFVVRPSRRDMYRAVPVAVGNNDHVLDF